MGAVTKETSSKFDVTLDVDTPHRVRAHILEQNVAEIPTSASIVDRKSRIRAESRSTFTVLGEAQLKRAAGETGEHLDPSMRLD